MFTISFTDLSLSLSVSTPKTHGFRRQKKWDGYYSGMPEVTSTAQSLPEYPEVGRKTGLEAPALPSVATCTQLRQHEKVRFLHTSSPRSRGNERQARPGASVIPEQCLGRRVADLSCSLNKRLRVDQSESAVHCASKPLAARSTTIKLADSARARTSCHRYELAA